MRYVLVAALMLGWSAPAMAEDAKPAPTITRSVKVDKLYNNVIIEDIETGCQTIILISGLIWFPFRV